MLRMNDKMNKLKCLRHFYCFTFIKTNAYSVQFKFISKFSKIYGLPPSGEGSQYYPKAFSNTCFKITYTWWTLKPLLHSDKIYSSCKPEIVGFTLRSSSPWLGGETRQEVKHHHTKFCGLIP